jgi:hypothetical protein
MGLGIKPTMDYFEKNYDIDHDKVIVIEIELQNI